MVSRPTRTLLAISLGTLLLVNPAFGLPGEATKTYTYAAEPVDGPDSVEQTERFEVHVLQCQFATRNCLFERRAAADAVRVESPRTRNASDLADYRFVRLDDGFYRPTARYENGSYVLGLEPVSERTVLDALAYHDEDGVPELAARAVSEGAVNVTVPLEEEQRYGDSMLVESGGTYYVVRVVESDIDRPITQTQWFRLLRGLGVLVGGVLVLYGYNLPEGEEP